MIERNTLTFISVAIIALSCILICIVKYIFNKYDWLNAIIMCTGVLLLVLGFNALTCVNTTVEYIDGERVDNIVSSEYITDMSYYRVKSEDETYIVEEAVYGEKGCGTYVLFNTKKTNKNILGFYVYTYTNILIADGDKKEEAN